MERIVIIADDNESLRGVLVRTLSRIYTHVEGVENGAKLVEKVRNGECAVVFTDYDMPVMDGIAAVRKIREFSAIPIYMNSGSNDGTLKQRAFKAGVTGFSTKCELIQWGSEYYRQILVQNGLIC